MSLISFSFCGLQVLCFLLCGSIEAFSDANLPHKFEFTEGKQHYYVLALLDPKDNSQLKGFQVFDSKDQVIQFIEHEQDLSGKVPEYILGQIPSGQPVQFIDFNFDGYPDIMMKDDISPRFQAFETWLWDPKQNKFIYDQALADAEINSVDPKKKYLYSGGSGGHGTFAISAYTYSPSGKLILLYTDSIDYRENSEIMTYYSDGKVTKTVKSVPPPEQ